MSVGRSCFHTTRLKSVVELLGVPWVTITFPDLIGPSPLLACLLHLCAQLRIVDSLPSCSWCQKVSCGTQLPIRASDRREERRGERLVVSFPYFALKTTLGFRQQDEFQPLREEEDSRRWVVEDNCFFSFFWFYYEQHQLCCTHGEPPHVGFAWVDLCLLQRILCWLWVCRAELLRENKRMLDKSIREIERERQSLQTQEKKLIAEIKKTAKQGQMVSFSQAIKLHK